MVQAVTVASNETEIFHFSLVLEMATLLSSDQRYKLGTLEDWICKLLLHLNLCSGLQGQCFQAKIQFSDRE